MIKLTKEQIEQGKWAYEVAWNNSSHIDSVINGLTAAAPYLQMPWEMPSEEELTWCDGIYRNAHGVTGRADRVLALRKFIERRNAALLPKPVDSRREKLIPILARLARWHVNDAQDHIVDAILAALDGK